MIDWSKLKPYRGDKWKSFEELCYQMAKGLYQRLGRFTPIDDSGGGDGVEFYLTMPNGEEWGWQARFYYPQPRLSESNRKRSIKQSLERSIETHPKLTKWFLCTPTNFTPSEQRWFEKLQAQHPDVALEHWSDSHFNDFLSDPRFVGKKNHFFGELELSMEWFRTRVEKELANVKDRFKPNLHTETKADFAIHALVGDFALVQHLEEQAEGLRNHTTQFDETVEELRKTVAEIDWEGTRNRLLAYCTQLKASLVEIDRVIAEAIAYLSSGRYEQVGQIDWEAIAGQFQEWLHEYLHIVREFEPEQLRYSGTDEAKHRICSYIRSKAYAPLRIARQIADLLHEARTNIERVSQQDMHIFGEAAIGKTHIACHVCQERIVNGLPAILLLGRDFISNAPLDTQILQLLDIPASYSFDDFVRALNSAAQAYRTKIPIVIDGLNEAQSVDIWRYQLPGLIYLLASLPQAVLITTCRSNYREAIWDTTEPQNAIETYGFEANAREEAIVKYFEWYKIKCDLTLAPLAQFSHPLYLRIFCETQNRERREEKEIYLGEQTLFQVFEEYISQCNGIVCARLSKHPSSRIVQNALAKVASELWQRRDRYVPFPDAVRLIDCKDMADLDWPSSLTSAILDEGLLVDRDWMNGQEVVLFTYDLLGGYVIAKELLDAVAPKTVEAFVRSDDFETLLLSHDYSERHPLHEDILSCYAALLPAQLGVHLYELTDNRTALGYSVDALFEIAPELVDEQSKELISNLFSHPDNRVPLLRRTRSTIANVRHPLNMDFWDRVLASLAMPERDLSWTESVRENSSNFIDELEKFENTCKETETLTEIAERRLALAARYFRWLLTSTVRPLRDMATRALYWYGRRLPEEFFHLVMGSLSVNDPYVRERMLAAAYGVAMALQYDSERPDFRRESLPAHARRLYEAMFRAGAPYATTHILARDYARRTVDIALIHNPDLLTPEERRRITPPFPDGGIRDWRESEDRDEGEYREGSMPIHMDFANYTLGSLVCHRANYDFGHEDYKQVRANIYWRLYDLGYSHDLFKEIDKRIHRDQWSFGRADSPGKTDRYGKKYSWIAYYELAGFREDNGLRPERFEERILDADIDPSFPGPVQEHEVIKSDYLGSREIPVFEWIENGGTPDLTPYLILEELCNERGPWVLLDGFINQEDLEANRARFIFPRGLMVRQGEVSEVFERLKSQDLGGRWLPEIPGDYYTYAGEIPWCDTFPDNGVATIDFVVGSRVERVPEDGITILRDGVELTSDELRVLLDKLRDLLYQTREDEAIEAFLKEEGVTLIPTTTYREKTIREMASFEVLIPVRYNRWGDYHSAVNPGRSALVPAKELAEALDLCSQPQTFDLYEKNGKRASITLRWGEAWYTEHRLIYLRHDLLERYLAVHLVELVWAIWGEREFASRDIAEHYAPATTHKLYHGYQGLLTYSQVKEGRDCN